MPTLESVTNADIFLWALYELGGADGFIDVENAFIRTFDLAPERLSWRTRSDLPDLKKCSKGLQEAEARKPRLLVKNGPYARMLSAEGQRWIEENFDRLANALGQANAVQPPRQRRSSRLVSQIVSSDLFNQWEDTSRLPEEKWQVAELLNCSPDSSQAVWDRRFEELKAAAYLAGQGSLLSFLESVKDKHQEWFGDD
jgi:hypothetical protein